MTSTPIVLFPSNPLHPTAPDSAFEDEARHAAAAGFEIGFIDLELFLGGEVNCAACPKAPVSWSTVAGSSIWTRTDA
jgi:hypothetical protein